VINNSEDRYIKGLDGITYKICPSEKIPNDDPNLPSYCCDQYRKHKPALDLIADVFCGDVKRHLPQWSREPKAAYDARVKRTLFHNVFKPIVSGFPGFLSHLSNKESLYEKLLECENNIDLQGNSLESFQWQVDLAVLRDGCVGVIVDMPSVESEGDEERPSDDVMRAYLVMVDRRDILSWEESVDDGNSCFERVTIRRCIERPVGLYGSEQITTFKSLFDDGSYRTEVICLVQTGRGEECISVVIELGQSTLQEVPLIVYSATDINPLCAEPPLLNLAEKNLSHYNLWSEMRDIIHKLNIPVLVRKGAINSNQDTPPPITIGSNTAIDLVKDGDAFFISPNDAVLTTDRAELDSLMEAMIEDSLRFLSGSSGTQKTATETLLSSSQIRATMSGIARLKVSYLQTVNKKWARYYGVEIDQCEISVNDDLLKLPIDPQSLSALSSMVTSGQLSTITMLEILSEGLRLPDGVTPAQEVQRIAAQQKLQQRRARDELAYQSQLTAQVNDQVNQKSTNNEVKTNGNSGNGKNQNGK
jgi:hypothetical protein